MPVKTNILPVKRKWSNQLSHCTYCATFGTECVHQMFLFWITCCQAPGCPRPPILISSSWRSAKTKQLPKCVLYFHYTQRNHVAGFTWCNRRCWKEDGRSSEESINGYITVFIRNARGKDVWYIAHGDMAISILISRCDISDMDPLDLHNIKRPSKIAKLDLKC